MEIFVYPLFIPNPGGFRISTIKTRVWAVLYQKEIDQSVAGIHISMIQTRFLEIFVSAQHRPESLSFTVSTNNTNEVSQCLPTTPTAIQQDAQEEEIRGRRKKRKTKEQRDAEALEQLTLKMRKYTVLEECTLLEPNF
ncbi:hypothetical protein RRG08_008218 [Elysia crispata]|uniref:Uncharacterized protein n=1 Tax=Elysia crispata TaxID=231223 RepID=A0AAE1CWA2_9GAST|nr:hypothetical protein RRG08_008218 [Elysia crispata]